MALTPFDDYPIHQTPLPVAHPGTSDRNFYDRYFFHGYDPDAGWFFAAAMGVYPNRRVIDAAFSIVHEGVQRSVFASGRAPLDRGVTSVGPLSIDVVEPFRTLRVLVEHDAVHAELTFSARTPVLEEPRMTIDDGTVNVLDSTRLVQLGSWTGSISLDGASLVVDPRRARGTRDRSWGVRPIGEPAGGVPTGVAGGGLFFLWAPVHFEYECTHLALFERPDLGRFYTSACAVPTLAPASDVFGSLEGVRVASSVSYSLELERGTRRSRSASLTYRYADTIEELSFEPLLTFQMKGLGYFHPERAHGVWQGEESVASETWKLDELNLLDPTNFHVEQLCRVRRGNERGIGVLEQLILGPHAGSGLGGFVDVAT